jgi:hypothetical protein
VSLEDMTCLILFGLWVNVHPVTAVPAMTHIP